MKKILFLMILFPIITLINSEDKPDDLEINILPSDKYRINKRDLLNLKSDIERQMMQRVYEIQSSWDQRSKLRHFALRPPMQPSLPYKSPIYNPNLLSLMAKPSPDGHRDMSTINNAGFSGYSFSEKKKHRDDSEIDPIRILKEHDEKIEKAKINLEAEIDEKFQTILKEKEKAAMKSIKFTQAKKNIDQNDMSIINKNKNMTDYSSIHEEKYSNTDSKKENGKEKVKTQAEVKKQKSIKEYPKDVKNPEGLDYNSIADVMTKMFEKLNKKMEKSAVLQMIHGKDKDQIMKLMSFIKEHSDAVLPSQSKQVKKENSKEVRLKEESNEENKEKKSQGKSKPKKNENKTETQIENEAKSEIKNDVPIQIQNKNEIDNDSKYFKSVSPFDEVSQDNKDQMDIKYTNQARFLSTKTEIKTEDKSGNSKTSLKDTSNLKVNRNIPNKERKEENRNGDESSLFVFQDGPINLEIF